MSNYSCAEIAKARKALIEHYKAMDNLTRDHPYLSCFSELYDAKNKVMELINNAEIIIFNRLEKADE